jgi:hypothetical protein
MSDDGWGSLYPGDVTAEIPDAFDGAEAFDDSRPPKRESSAAERVQRGPNQATELVQLARARYEVIRGDDGKLYATARTLPGVAFGLHGKGGLRSQLAAAYYDEKSRAAGGGALQDALAVLEGDAMRAPERSVHLRTGRHRGALIIDRATPHGHAIRITAAGWSLVDQSPILFRRSAVSMQMPIPEAGGDLSALRNVLNLDDASFRLVIAFALAAFIPDIAHPILALIGQQGTAKTTAARIVLNLIDPSAGSLQSQPRTAEEWAVAAFNVYGIGLDNVSVLPAWLQDALCKAVTGDAFVRRELYSDDTVTVLRYRRPIALTTIEPGALQGDVADRLLPVELQPIDARHRRTEADVMKAVETAGPQTLGALLDLLAKVLRELPNVKLEEKPRMADFAEVLAALDAATGWTTLHDYMAAADSAARDVVDGDSFASAVVEHLRRVGYWEGRCIDLLHALENDLPDDRRPRDWPRTAKAVQQKLVRTTQPLASSGVVVTRDHARSNRGAIYRLELRTERILCDVCHTPLDPTLAASGERTHPTCDPGEQ